MRANPRRAAERHGVRTRIAAAAAGALAAAAVTAGTLAAPAGADSPPQTEAECEAAQMVWATDREDATSGRCISYDGSWTPIRHDGTTWCSHAARQSYPQTCAPRSADGSNPDRWVTYSGQPTGGQPAPTSHQWNETDVAEGTCRNGTGLQASDGSCDMSPDAVSRNGGTPDRLVCSALARLYFRYGGTDRSYVPDGC